LRVTARFSGVVMGLRRYELGVEARVSDVMSMRRTRVYRDAIKLKEQPSVLPKGATPRLWYASGQPQRADQLDPTFNRSRLGDHYGNLTGRRRQRGARICRQDAVPVYQCRDSALILEPPFFTANDFLVRKTARDRLDSPMRRWRSRSFTNCPANVNRRRPFTKAGCRC